MEAMSWDKILTDDTTISDLYDEQSKIAESSEAKEMAEFLALGSSPITGAIAGGLSAYKARKLLREKGFSEEEIKSMTPGIIRSTLGGAATSGASAIMGSAQFGEYDKGLGSTGGAVASTLGSGLGAAYEYKKNMNRARNLIKARESGRAKQKKVAGLGEDVAKNMIDFSPVIAGATAGGLSAHKARKLLREKGFSEEEIKSMAPNVLARTALGGLKGTVSAIGGMLLTSGGEPEDKAKVVGGLLGATHEYRRNIKRAKDLIKARAAGMGKSSMNKEAGLFMRPSEIGDHQNLTHALEAKLNGASPEPQFKLARSTRSTAGGAAIGAVGGFTAHHKAKNREVRELAPEQVKGVRGKIRKAINSAQRAQTEFAKKSPKTSMAVHTSAGAIAGGAVGGPTAKTLNRALRRR